MKRILCLLLALTMLAALCACEKPGDPNATENSSTEPSTTAPSDPVEPSETTAPTEPSTEPSAPSESTAPAECLHERSRRETEATCTEAGLIIHECLLCGDVAMEETPALGHSYTDATCTAPKTCTRCGAADGTALGHNYVKGNCSRCGAKMPNAEITPSDCEHTWNIQQTAATCTEAGKTVYTCTKCAHSHSETIPPRGHQYADATCEKPKTCTVCSSTTGSPLTHSYQSGACIHCGAIDPNAPIEISYKVTIRSDKGKTIPGVTVQIYTNGTAPVAAGTTDSKGVFSTTLTKHDTYTIVLSDIPEGYRSKESYTFTSNMVNINLVTIPVIKPDDHSQADYQAGSIMGDFTLTDVEGITYNLSELLKEKKLIILDFWYVTCAPCKAEFPYFESIHKNYADDVQLLTFTPFDSEASIKALREDMGVTFPMIRDTIKLHLGFGVEAYPTTVFIDSSGKILKVKTGTYPSEADLIRDIERFLK